jgi:hypothetical protein
MRNEFTRIAPAHFSCYIVRSLYLIIIVIIVTQRERIVPYLIPVYIILGDSA